jgi:predicted metal-dependent phosphoesterase TrpH
MATSRGRDGRSGKNFVIIDLHVHTRRHSGCSRIEPGDLIEAALNRGLEGLVLTEHGILWREDRLAVLREEAGAKGLLILAGQEITCLEQGRRKDFLVFGVDRSLSSNQSPAELVAGVHGEGGVIVAAHPFKPSRLGAGYHGIGEEIYDLDVDAVEVLHPEHDEKARERAAAAAREKGIPATGGSDAHERERLGTFATRFLDPVNSMPDLVRGIHEGRVEPVQGRDGGRWHTRPAGPAGTAC